MLNENDVEMIASAGELLANADNLAKDENVPCVAEVDRGTRCHTVLTYIEPKYLKAFLNNATWILHWAYCYHDKDVWTADDEKVNEKHKEGTSKTPHTHIVLYTKDCKTYSAICKQFKKYSVSIYGADKAQNTRCEYCDLNKQYRYLLHKDDPDKHPYSPDCLVQDDPLFWEKYDKGMIDEPNGGYKIVEDILSGIPYRTLAMKYGRDYIYHAKQYDDIAQKIRIEECVANSPINDELISVVLDSSPFGVLQKDDFFMMINYLREVFHNEFNNPYGFEIYLKKLGLGD